LPADALGRLSPVTVAMSPGGPVVAWQADNVLAQGVPARDWFSSAYVGILNLPLAGDGAEPRLTAYEPAQPGHPPELPRMDYRPKVTHGGEEYTVLYGNLHEHTNFSRCWADGSDGTLDDNYRYGIEVMGYDFVGMTDHGYDLVELRWERTIRASRFYRDTPYFVGIPGFEWTLSGEEKPPGSGHRNVIFGGDDHASRFVGQAGAVLDSRLTEASNMPDKVWRILREQGATAVTIPHHTADKQHPIDWDYHDDEYQCVAEIFQARQSCEHAGCPRETPNLTEHPGCYLQDGLTRGHRFGFIASGDHNSMGQGIAAVLVKEISLEGILEALRARRCFATTGAKILMDFRVDDMVQGEEGPAGDAPRIQATIDGTAPLTNVVVFRSNEVMYELTEDQLEGRRSLRLDFEDEGRGGSEFYYARAIQADNEIAWSSPVWVDA
ncbi:MAG: DUF3604 domain-containing protein, partial [Armatimonadia bacterium]|nr:DUF3604 domain-containing protein [Armatimonadia bacterium]